MSLIQNMKNLYWRAQEKWYDDLRPLPRGVKHAERAYRRFAVRQRDVCPEDPKLNVLFFALRGWQNHLIIDGILALRLRQRGSSTRFLTCDGTLPFCMNGNISTRAVGKRPCEGCGKAQDIFIKPYFEFTEIGTGDEDPEAEKSIASFSLDECFEFSYQGIPLGECCRNTLIWWMRRARLEPEDVVILRKILIAGIRVVNAFQTETEIQKPDVVFMLNGEFFAEQIVSRLCKKQSIRFVTYDYCFIGIAVGHGHACWQQICEEKKPLKIPEGKSKHLSKLGKSLLEKWIKNKGYQGKRDWNQASEDEHTFTKPLAVAFTNQNFESSVIGKERLFQSQIEWLKKLIGYFEAHPEYQFAIRVHPAELRQDHWAPKESILDEINPSKISIPENVMIVKPGDSLSTYQLLDMADVCLVYTTTVGMEAASRTVPVITAANAHFAQRGFTIDPENEEDFFTSLDNTLAQRPRLTSTEMQALYLYVGWFFYYRVLHLEPLRFDPGYPPLLSYAKLNQMAKGKAPNMDRLCELIESGKEWW